MMMNRTGDHFSQLFECELVRIKIEKGLNVWPTAAAHDEDWKKNCLRISEIYSAQQSINSLRSLNFSFKYPGFIFGCSSNLAQVNTTYGIRKRVPPNRLCLVEVGGWAVD